MSTKPEFGAKSCFGCRLRSTFFGIGYEKLICKTTSIGTASGYRKLIRLSRKSEFGVKNCFEGRLLKNIISSVYNKRT